MRVRQLLQESPVVFSHVGSLSSGLGLIQSREPPGASGGPSLAATEFLPPFPATGRWASAGMFSAGRSFTEDARHAQSPLSFQASLLSPCLPSDVTIQVSSLIHPFYP